MSTMGKIVLVVVSGVFVATGTLAFIKRKEAIAEQQDKLRRSAELTEQIERGRLDSRRRIDAGEPPEGP